MRIIKQGVLNSYRFTCPYCGCEYEYDDSDLHEEYGLTSTGSYNYVICPCCGKKNIIYNYTKKWDYPYYPPYGPIYCSNSYCCEDKNTRSDKNE